MKVINGTSVGFALFCLCVGIVSWRLTEMYSQANAAVFSKFAKAGWVKGKYYVPKHATSFHTFLATESYIIQQKVEEVGSCIDGVFRYVGESALEYIFTAKRKSHRSSKLQAFAAQYGEKVMFQPYLESEGLNAFVPVYCQDWVALK